MVLGDRISDLHQTLSLFCTSLPLGQTGSVPIFHGMLFRLGMPIQNWDHQREEISE